MNVPEPSVLRRLSGSQAAIRPDQPARPSISTELAEFIHNLAIAMQRNAIYPKGHPQLAASVEDLIRRLALLFHARDSLALGIARDQFVVEGMATDPDNEQLRELAQKLHRHHLSAVRISAGISGEELADLLLALAVDPGITAKQLVPLKVQLQRWPHVRLYTLLFERLELLGGRTDAGAIAARGVRIWGALARAALLADASAELSDEEAGEVEPEVVAQALERGVSDAAYDQMMMGHFLAAGEELAGIGTVEESSLRERISGMLRSIRPETLRRLLAMGGDPEQRRKLLLDSTNAVAADAVVKLLEAVAQASSRPVSQPLLRLFGKLARQAEQGGAMLRAGSDLALRERVQQLAEGWTMEEITAGNYREVLDRASRSRIFTTMREREQPCEPWRMVMTGIEADTLGAAVWRAVHDMEIHRRVGALLELLVRAPEPNAVALTLWEHTATPEQLAELLSDDSVDFALLERVVMRMGVAVVDQLLATLESAESRATRRKMMDLLARFGDEIGAKVTARLAPDRPWFVHRNLLALLNLSPPSHAFDPTRYIQHPDARVRREALKLSLRMPEFRERGIVAGIADQDERTAQMALLAALEDCPRPVVAPLMRMVEQGKLAPSLRSLAVRAVASATQGGSPDWLLHLVLVRKGWWIFRRPTLAGASPETVAAVGALARSWPDDPRTERVLQLARLSPDPQLRGAGEPPARRKSA